MRFNDFGVSFPAWKLYRALGKRHLPFAGGFAEQPAWLMEDIATLEFMAYALEMQEQMQEQEIDAENA